MKAYMEVKDILNILHFNEIDFVSIIDEEKDDLIERFEWGSKSMDYMRKKEYMSYYPTLISIAEDKEIIIRCIKDD